MVKHPAQNNIQEMAAPGKPAVFLDRDGVINKEVGYLTSKDELELIPGADEGIEALSRAGFLNVVVTNQSIIALGGLSEPGLEEIHARLSALLGRNKASIDKFYYCPHIPPEYLPPGMRSLERPCLCHKPGTGMFEQARDELGIDFSRSWMVGDRTTDIMAAKNAGITSILVRTGAAGRDGLCAVYPDYMADDLEAASDFIVREHPASLKALDSIVKNIKRGDNVLVGGLARSGKSTLTSLLCDALKARGLNARKITLDSFLRPDEERGNTVLERYNMEKITAFAALIKNRPAAVSLPHYNPVTHELTEGAINFDLLPDDVFVMEGVVALNHPALLDIAAQKFYIVCGDSVRRERFARDYTLRGKAGTWAELFAERELEERPVIEKGKLSGTILDMDVILKK